MKSAFGMKLEEESTGMLVGRLSTGESVNFWRSSVGQQWRGSLSCGGHMITEDIGCASPEACYRSLRGRARNLMRGLEKLGVKA